MHVFCQKAQKLQLLTGWSSLMDYLAGTAKESIEFNLFLFILTLRLIIQGS